MLQNGEILDGMYQVVREIGKGGTGVIYLGYHLRLQKQVVIKRIKDSVAGRVNVRAEADILKKLHHTFLPQVYDFLEVRSGIYTVMDYIPGHDLQYYLDEQYTFPEKTVLVWLTQLAEVLEYLHTRTPQILHSDIKPANIMITPEGNVCLIDFNISLDKDAGQEVQGVSPYYAAPEQYQAAVDRLYGKGSRIRLDERMDIYSLGAVFYRVMTGWFPDPRAGVPHPIMDLEIPYSDGLKNVIRKAMEPSPRNRFASAGQMKKALENVARMDPAYRRLTWLGYLAGAACALVAVVGVLLIYAGAQVHQKELWQEAYRAFYQAAESGNEADVVSQGTQILNDYSLNGYLDRHPKSRAEVLHTVGESYFRQGQYDQAAAYYKEALKEDETSAVYLRDYLIAMAGDGRYEEAEQVVRDYPEIHISEAEHLLAAARDAWKKGEASEALALAEDAGEQSRDRDLNAKILSLQGEIYMELEDYGQAADAMAEAAKLDPGADYIRSAGMAAFQAGTAAEGGAGRQTYYEQALACYEELNRREDPSYEDQMSLGLVLRALGQYGNSLEHFRRMKEAYPSDYQIQMWMCYNILDEAAVEKNYQDEASDLNFWYHSCKRLYDAGGKEDEDMEELIRIMEVLEENS